MRIHMKQTFHLDLCMSAGCSNGNDETRLLGSCDWPGARILKSNLAVEELRIRLTSRPLGKSHVPAYLKKWREHTSNHYADIHQYHDHAPAPPYAHRDITLSQRAGNQVNQVAKFLQCTRTLQNPCIRKNKHVVRPKERISSCSSEYPADPNESIWKIKRWVFHMQ